MKLKIVKAEEVKRTETDIHIRRHVQSLRILLDKKPAAEAKMIVQKEFNKFVVAKPQDIV